MGDDQTCHRRYPFPIENISIQGKVSYKKRAEYQNGELQLDDRVDCKVK